MSLARAEALQAAIYARLAARLSDAAVGGGPVPVYDHIPQDPPRLHVRIDAFTVDELPTKDRRHGVHRFDAHVFDRPGEVGGRGQKETKRVMALIDAALSGVRVLAGAPPFAFDGAFVDLDADGATVHGRATYSVILSGA